MTALALAPSTVSLNSQHFLPVAKILMSRSRRLLSIGILPSFDVARQIIPLVQGVGYGIAELGVRQDLRRDFVEPCLEGVQDGQAVLLAEAANAVGLRFAVVGLFVSRLPFNPVELFEEPAAPAPAGRRLSSSP